MSGKHLLCVDLEACFFLLGCRKASRMTIDELRRYDNNYSVAALEKILKILKKYDQRITFFVVFRLEEMYPGLLDTILEDGHEVGWHTHSHENIRDAGTLVRELEQSFSLIKKYAIKGFRAPNIIFFREGYKILKEYGFIYSSSVYGNSSAAYNLDGIREIPVSVSRRSYSPDFERLAFPQNLTVKNVLKFGIPFGSGYFWKILGGGYYDRKMKSLGSGNNICNLFIHEWQILTPQTKVFRKKVSLSRNPFYFPYSFNLEEMFAFMLKNYKFEPVIDYVESLNSQDDN